MVYQTQQGCRLLHGELGNEDDGARIERKLELMLRLSNSLETLHDIRIDESLRRPDHSPHHGV